MWKYEFSRESIKVLENLDTKTANLVKKKIKNLGMWLDDRKTLHADIKKLKGKWKGFYRLRIGKMRVLVSIADKNEVIKVHGIGFRGDVYKSKLY
ncbi:MAG: type II toxin-antitoxin system RelE/ParE family toxin [Candidatus Zixiibacteriota bacterium]